MTLKDGYGFIRCWDRDARIFFHFSEFVNNTSIPRMNDVLEFAVVTVSVCSRLYYITVY